MNSDMITLGLIRRAMIDVQAEMRVNVSLRTDLGIVYDDMVCDLADLEAKYVHIRSSQFKKVKDNE